MARLRSYCLLVALLLLAFGRAGAADSPEAMRLIDCLQQRLAQCRDYQCLFCMYERKGDREEERSYRLYVKGSRLVRIKVVKGRGKGSEATIDASGRVRGRKGGLLKAFARTLQPDDHRICSLRGTPFWEAAYHNVLKDLRAHIMEPGTRSEVATDPDQPDQQLLVLDRSGGIREKYWIDSQRMQIVRGELFENDVLVRQFSIKEIKENVGLSDSFFSF